MNIIKPLKAFVLISALLICLASCAPEKKETPKEIQLLNRCSTYIETFSSASPDDALELKKVSDDCLAVLESEIFDEYYEQSAFKSNSVISERENEYRQSHYCEIMMLRLKCLLLSGDYEEYNTEFLMYIKKIDSNTFTRQRFPEFFKNDTSLALSEEQLAAVGEAYTAAIGTCSDEIEKYILYNEEYSFIGFYSDDEALKEKLFEQFTGIKALMGDEAFEKHYNEWNGFASED